MKTTRTFFPLLSGMLLVLAPGIAAAAADPATHDADALAKQLANPVAALISVPIQENLDFGYANGGWRSTTNIQPVIPIGLNDDWNLISRTIVPVIFQDDVTGSGNSESGLGDIIQSCFFSPKAPTANGWIWGVGPVFGLPIGSDDFSVDRWMAGPTAVFLKQEGVWTYGALVNHLWDFAGSGNADVSSTFLQPFLVWGGLGKGQTIALNTESTYDWNASQWTIPINLAYNKVSKIGNQLVSYQAGARVYLDSPTGGPDWGLRFGLTLLFPK